MPVDSPTLLWKPMATQIQGESAGCVFVPLEYRSPTQSDGIQNVDWKVQITAKEMTSTTVNSQYHLNL